MGVAISVKHFSGRLWPGTAVLVAGALLWPAHPAAQQSLPPEVVRYADAIYTNGKVLTVDKDFSIREAIAIRDGKVIATGTTAAIERMAGPQTRKYDLGGRSLIPGLIDTHWHPWNGAIGRHGSQSDWHPAPASLPSRSRPRATPRDPAAARRLCPPAA